MKRTKHRKAGDKPKVVRIILGGSGGQGIVSLGKVLANAGIHAQMDVSCLPSYGAEMRGGYVYCTLVLSSRKDISSPVISQADIAAFMNEASSQILTPFLKSGGHLFLNASLVKEQPPKSAHAVALSATETAESLGDVRVANMVMAGAVAACINRFFAPFSPADLQYGIKGAISHKDAWKICRAAAELGWAEAEAVLTKKE